MKIDWEKLAALRERFLQGAGPGPDYWTPELLELYDRTFAERIRWKWQAVLTESAEHLPSGIDLVDFGCGTGAAVETMLAFQPHWRNIRLWDRSPAALAYTAEKLKNSTIRQTLPAPGEKYFLLVSHVLGELNGKEKTKLTGLLQNAEGFVVVEPGTATLGAEIVSLRESLREYFRWLAPCPHQEACGLVGKNKDWCHHFAPPPDSTFRDAFWKEFSDRLKIDLRSLPVSYLVAVREAQGLQEGQRIIGRPRQYKGYSLALVCDKNGVSEKKYLARRHKDLLKKWEKTQLVYPYLDPDLK